MVKVAMLSFAHVHAEGYAKQVEANPNAEIVAIWDEEEYGGRPAAEKRKVPFYSDLDKLLSLAHIDGVVVNAPTSLHKEVMVKAAQAQKHIFTEKALAPNVKECDEIIEAVKKAGVKFMISLPSRCRPEILLAKKAVDEGVIGELTLGRGRIAHSASLDGWFPPKAPSTWFGDKKRAGGGALFDLGCHRVDVIRWLLGEPISVISKMNNFANRYDIDDNTVTVVEFANKALGIIDVSWTHRSGPNLLELYGTEGSLVIGHPSGIVITSRKLSEDQVKVYISSEGMPKALPTPMEQWINALRNNEPMTITIQDGRNLTELLQAAYISAESGREVKLPL